MVAFTAATPMLTSVRGRTQNGPSANTRVNRSETVSSRCTWRNSGRFHQLQVQTSEPIQEFRVRECGSNGSLVGYNYIGRKRCFSVNRRVNVFTKAIVVLATGV